MQKHIRPLWILLSLVVLGAVLVACQPAEVAPEVVKETVIVEVEVTPEPGMEMEVPFEDLWAGSGHADASAEAFRHWDEDDPAEIPGSCAKCHSEHGYLDFLGVDGTEVGVVDNAAELGTVVSCVACHNSATVVMDTVVMPSGAEITGLGDESRCMQCHQGRESSVSVNASIEEAGVEDDVISEDLGFLNIHYYAAAATKYGTEAKGGYEYDGKTYDAFFVHVEGYETCVECHNPHTLQIKIEECTACHTGVSTVEDLYDVRMPGSMVDYDGDGDIAEGVFYEIEGLREMLYTTLQAYAAEVVGSPVVYDSHSYPYFFNDTNADGEAGEDEAAYPNRYATWTPRLLRAAYNYQVSLKDPGGFAHGGKYMIQLLLDSIEDLNVALSTPVDLTGTHRIDHGHFAGSEEAFRHWDEDGAVEVPCSRCHSATGIPLYVTEGVVTTQPLSNGLLCSTCHNDLATWSQFEVASVTFPSGKKVDSGDATMNLCMTCHQGMSSTPDLNELLASAHPLNAEGEPDETRIASADQVSPNLAARSANPHYFAAGATIFGTSAQGGYQYAGRTYQGRFEHVSNFNTCTACHSAHQLVVKVEACTGCHTEMEADQVETIRKSTVDYDGDGDAAEGLAGEVQTMREALLAAIQKYVSDKGLDAILYEGHAYPYWFTDSNANGEADPGEAIYPNQYSTWTPRLLQAAYNYNYATKDPGAFAHNGKYVLQLLYDSIRDLGGSTSGMVRP